MKYTFLPAILIGVTLLSGCTWGGEGTNQSNTNPTSTGQVMMNPMLGSFENAPSVTDSLQTVSSKLQQEPQFRFCMAQSTNQCSNQLINTLVSKNDSTDICKEFKDKTLQETCANAIVTEKAKKSSNPDACNDLSTGAEQCRVMVVTEMAVTKKDPKICLELTPKDTPVGSNDSSSGANAMMLPVLNPADQCVQRSIYSGQVSEELKSTCELLSNQTLKTTCASEIDSRIKMMKSMNLPATPVVTPPPTVIPPAASQTGSSDSDSN